MTENFEQGLTEIASKMRRKDTSILMEGPAAFILRARDQIKMCNEENEAMAKEYDLELAALRGMDVRIVMREENLPTEELARCPECGEPVTCCTCYHCMPNPTV